MANRNLPFGCTVHGYRWPSYDNACDQMPVLITVVIEIRVFMVSRSLASPVGTINKIEKAGREGVSEFFPFYVMIIAIADLVKHSRASTKLAKHKDIMLVINLVGFTPKILAHGEESLVKVAVLTAV